MAVHVHLLVESGIHIIECLSHREHNRANPWPPGSVGCSLLRSENQLQPELDLPRRSREGGDGAEGRIAEVLCRRSEVGCIEQVEELGAELQAARFSPQRKLLMQAEVEVED